MFENIIEFTIKTQIVTLMLPSPSFSPKLAEFTKKLTQVKKKSP